MVTQPQGTKPSVNMDLLNMLLHQEGGGLDSALRWIVLLTIGALVFWATYAYWKQRPRSILPRLLLAAVWIAAIEALVMVVLAYVFPDWLVSVFGVSSVGFLHPVGVSAVIGMIHFGRNLLWGSLILVALALVGIEKAER